MRGHRLYPPQAYLAATDDKRGRGVFTTTALALGTLVETVPVVPLDTAYDELPPALQTRVFDWLALTTTDGPRQALALGFGSLYNHDNPANLRYVADPETLLLAFIAARDIDNGEELTINYNGAAGGPVSHTDDWFERTGIRRV